ncbi:Mitochondrial import inner membrane translocase subunit Tim21 [Brevibacillus sp. IT-7CA2]|uniref:hypothetical protein n=1 Tax=Brevibacillus sp. IT-7CA2 TaxID=3026436 RepID=UPI0039DFE996
MTLTEWLGIGGFILGVTNLAVHLYIQFIRKAKLEIEIIEPCKIVSNIPGQAHLQVNLRLKAIHGPVFLRTARLYHDSLNAGVSVITPPTRTPQYSFNTENGVNFNITHFHTLINNELSTEILDLIKIWNDNEFIDIRDLKIDKDDAKSFTVLTSIYGPRGESGLSDDLEVKGWKLALEYDKQTEIINIPGFKLVKQYV